MIALVKFDEVLTQAQYDKLSSIYDFGKITNRVYNDYSGYHKLPEDGYFFDEVIKNEENHYCLTNGEEIPNYYLHKRPDGDYIAIEKQIHVVDLEELYKTCRTIQVRILEVAKI